MPEEKAKEKKLSQEEIKFANAAKRFLRQISIATKNFRTFGEGHPFLKGNIREAYETFKSLLIAKDSVTLTFIDRSCLVEDIPLKELDPKAYSFIGTAGECGITSLTFMEGLVEEELYILLKIVSSGPNAIRAEEGLANYLQRKNILNIKTDEVFFKRVSKKEEKTAEAKKHLEDFLVINYLLGKSAISKDDIESLVGEITVDPKRMGRIISDVAKGPRAGGEGADVDGVEVARASIEKIATHMKNVQDKPYDDLKEDIGNLILALEPSIRSKILESKIKLPEGSDDVVKDIITSLSDDIIMDVVVSDLVDKRSSVPEIRKLIERLLPDVPRRKRVFPMLEKRLLDKGVPQATCSKLLEERFWSDMDLEEKIKKILKEKPAFVMEVGLSDAVGDLIKDLLAEGKFTVVSDVLDKILENFKSDDADFKLRFIRDFERIFILLFQSEVYPYKDKLLNTIKIEFQKIKDSAVRKRFSTIFIDSIKLSLANKWHAHLIPLINIIGYETAKAEIFGDLDIEGLFREILLDDKRAWGTLKGLAKEMGPDAAAALGNISASILPDDFDSYRKRYLIAKIIKELGHS